MTGVEIVQDIVDILVAGITQLGSGIGAGVSNFVTAMAFTGTGENQTLSIWFIVLCVFAGLSLAISLTRLVFGWLESFGARG